MLHQKLKSMNKYEKRILLKCANNVDFANFGKTYIRLELSAALEAGDYIAAAAVINDHFHEFLAGLYCEHDRMMETARFEGFTPEERAHDAYMAEIIDRMYKFMLNNYFGREE